MARKALHTQRSGVGRFPLANSSPPMVAVVAPPLHTSDEWEQNGRPFWLLRYSVGKTHRPGTDDGYLYARTLTPTYCPLQIVSIPPVSAGYIECGACGDWIPAPWREVRDMRAGLAFIREGRKLNPISVVYWCRDLWEQTAQQYAVPGNIRAAQSARVPPEGWPKEMDYDKFCEKHEEPRMVDDGCPNTKEDE